MNLKDDSLSRPRERAGVRGGTWHKQGDAMAALLPSPPPSSKERGSQCHPACIQVQMCRINRSRHVHTAL